MSDEFTVLAPARVEALQRYPDNSGPDGDNGIAEQNRAAFVEGARWGARVALLSAAHDSEYENQTDEDEDFLDNADFPVWLSARAEQIGGDR
ncbi:hypothetical protein Xcel_0555 [Xylanimonas cellulosilytica DSM 15894]|uniref:Uncharacterized protein n=1 Tax=Xylanimonas cellulosilytica (strain DSM 15894 / JCM 12276 / CECT 5975 / KCTC 9989 / LMG 20990 / NBRC 107835 / XIL07) TaxID=446471 RepID=D1BWL2_XYLCX|nr:hypothetical protein [Xylanimonas cellulosilytica]ACZ29594.1 hypothetical protein Xcel_0555 [Xylanimonas cellulosilytica DSM 15894]